MRKYNKGERVYLIGEYSGYKAIDDVDIFIDGNPHMEILVNRTKFNGETGEYISGYLKGYRLDLSKDIIAYDDYFNITYIRNKESMLHKFVEPGIYDIVDYDMEGRYVVNSFTVEVTKNMNEFYLAKMLYDKMGYRSAWGYLTVKPNKPKVDITI
jgi:hypothetical protein